MDPELKAFLDKYTAAHPDASDDELRNAANFFSSQKQGASPAAAAQPSSPAPITARDIGRAALQGATLHWGDEAAKLAHLPASMQPDMRAQVTFAKNHPVANFLAQLGGGVAAPVAAAFAAPELATVGGAAALGGAAGLISGAGDQNPNDTSPGQMNSRANQAAVQGATGLIGGAAGHMLGQAAGKVGGAIMDRMDPQSVMGRVAAKLFGGGVGPSRVVARNAEQFLTPDVQTRMNAVNELAPGGASIANSTVRPGTNVPRFTGYVNNGVGQNGAAGATSEADLLGQTGALKAALPRIGAKIQANEKIVPVTPEVRSAIQKARSLVGDYAPNVPAAQPGPGPTVPGFEATGITIPPDASHVTTTELHDAISRLGDKLFDFERQGINAPGIVAHDYTDAMQSLRDVMYKAAPELKPIDQQYAMIADQLRTTKPLLEAAQRSRENFSATNVTGTQPSPIGTNPVPTKHSIITGLTNKLFVNGKATAPEIARYLTAPGGSDAVSKLLSRLPAAHPVAQKLTDATASTLGRTASGMFEPEDY